jgi:aspartyl-tRNA(Asn)/glutamyl-tRNA(Gln) amidotransferase subunit A
MKNDDLTSLSLTEASQYIKEGKLSPVELTRAHLERIERLDQKLNSFITVTPDSALERAGQLEGELIQGKPKNPLFGIPMALKDLYETKGVRTTAGSKFFSNYVPEENGVAVQKLLQAGAIILGKLNMHEIALGVTNVNPHFGACRNPWSLDRITGGSSGGSGAALAAGFCLGSMGSDTGGSIRIPASLCNVVGLKPTYGRVSVRGVFPLSWNLDHAGPMARRVEDVALILNAIAGFDPEDPFSKNVPVENYRAHIQAGVNDWRIAVADDEYFRRHDPKITQAVHQAGKVFEDLGASVSEVAFPDARHAAWTNGTMTVADAAAFHLERIQNKPGDFGSDIRQRLESGVALSSSDYIQARRTQTILRRQFESFFDNFDVRYTAPFNLTGLPAISLPCGFSADGLPFGLQIISRPWEEAKVLRAAYAYESATGWHKKNPEGKIF